MLISKLKASRAKGVLNLPILRDGQKIWFRREHSASAGFSISEHTEVANLANSSQMEFRAGFMARFASGSAVLLLDDNAILSSVVTKFQQPPPGEFAIPAPAGSGIQLSVDFRQSAAAIGRIPMNYFRKELSQSDQDILTSRIIDRSLRPSFYPNFPGQIQIVCKPLATDETGDGVVMGINAASAALALSPIPLRCTVAATRMCIIDGKIVANPSRDLLKQSTMNAVLSATDDGKIVMIELEGIEVGQEIFLECVEQALTEIREINAAITRLIKAVNPKKFSYKEEGGFKFEALELCKVCEGPIKEVLTNYCHDKVSRDTEITKIRENWMKHIQDRTFQLTDDSSKTKCLTENEAKVYFLEYYKRLFREVMFETNRRCDGRQINELRPIDIKVDVFNKLHGSALFQRGQSQVFATLTFDSPAAAFHPDAIAQLLGAQRKKSFMLHYEFPRFAVNEIGDAGGQNRRELGHGLLAERALKNVLPEKFPYTIRLACQVLESNGSTSMASVCAGSLALYDAGVTLSSGHVAGIAIGLITNGSNMNDGKSNEDYLILRDINGLEDFMGDMDFKIAGTSKGFNAMQLDVKINGLNKQQLSEALESGHKGILQILQLMNEAISEPRSKFKDVVPVIELMDAPLFKRSVLFRSSAYNAKLIESETGVKITGENDSSIMLFAPNQRRLELAKEMIKKLFEEESDDFYSFGAIYCAEIVRILENGVMVILREGTKPMLLRNSDISLQIKHASAHGLQVGERINVQYFGRDPHSGFHRISSRAIQNVGEEMPIQNMLSKARKDSNKHGGNT